MKQLSFKTNIKKYRRQVDMTQEELAKRVGVTRETISYLENGKYNPSLRLAYQVAALFNVGIEEMFEFDELED